MSSSPSSPLSQDKKKKRKRATDSLLEEGTSAIKSDEKEETKEKGVSGRWTAEEDAELREAIRVMLSTPAGPSSGDSGDSSATNKKTFKWRVVSELLGRKRTPRQCYGRYTRLGMNVEGKTSRKLGQWESQEDFALLQEVRRQQQSSSEEPISWAQVSMALHGTRNRQQCMVRYKSVLQHLHSTNIHTGNWTNGEDTTLAEAVRDFRGKGRKGGIAWTCVSERMNCTRTVKQCKKRWDDVVRNKSTCGDPISRNSSFPNSYTEI